MRKILKTSLMLVLFWGLSGCSSVSVSTDYNGDVSFNTFKTFAWHPISSKAMNDRDYGYNALVQERIEQNIEAGLTERSFNLSSEPDFYVNYSVTTEDKLDVTTFNTYSGLAPGWGWGGRYGYRGMPPMEPTTIVSEYKVGTLIIDIVEPESNLLIWRGLGSKSLPSTVNKEDIDRIVQTVVESILDEFPPK